MHLVLSYNNVLYVNRVVNCKYIQSYLGYKNIDFVILTRVIKSIVPQRIRISRTHSI